MMRKGGLYLAIGDSTTYNTVNNGANLYPNKIATMIASNYAPIQLINKGVSGSTSSTWQELGLQRWAFTVGKPDLVTIGLGINDSGQSIPQATFESNLNSLIDKLRKLNPNVHIILCTASSLTNDTGQAPYRTYSDNVAVAKNVSVCHFETAWTTAQAPTNTADGVHPNDIGHPLLANVLWPIVQTGSWLNNLG